MDSRPHPKKRDSRFTTSFPELDLSGVPERRPCGVVAGDNEVTRHGGGGWLAALDHQEASLTPHFH